VGAESETQSEGEVAPSSATGRRRAVGLALVVAEHERTGSFELRFPVLVSVPEVRSDTPSIVIHEVACDDDGARVSVGRSLEDDIFVNEATVSRRHAALERTGGVWTVVDLGSLNGTFLDGRRLEAGVPATVTLATSTLGFGLSARFVLADESWLARYLTPLRAETRRLRPVREQPVHDYLVASILESLKESVATSRQYRAVRAGGRVDLLAGWTDLVRFVEAHAGEVLAVETLPIDGGPRLAYARCDGAETPRAPLNLREPS
jgi:hypothetical protein